MYLIRDPRDRIASRWQAAPNNKENSITLNSGHEIFKYEQSQIDYINVFEEFAPKCLVIRYEDLCKTPNEVQKTISMYFDLKIKVPFTEVNTQAWDFEVDHWSSTPLRGESQRDPLRPPDVLSIGQWKNHACREYAEEFVKIPTVSIFMDNYYADY